MGVFSFGKRSRGDASGAPAQSLQGVCKGVCLFPVVERRCGRLCSWKGQRELQVRSYRKEGPGGNETGDWTLAPQGPRTSSLPCSSGSVITWLELVPHLRPLLPAPDCSSFLPALPPNILGQPASLLPGTCGPETLPMTRGPGGQGPPCLADSVAAGAVAWLDPWRGCSCGSCVSSLVPLPLAGQRALGLTRQWCCAGTSFPAATTAVQHPAFSTVFL